MFPRHAGGLADRGPVWGQPGAGSLRREQRGGPHRLVGEPLPEPGSGFIPILSCEYLWEKPSVCGPSVSRQDPGRAAQQALRGRGPVHRTRAPAPRADRHARLRGLHHGARRQRAPAGAQPGAGVPRGSGQVRFYL